MKILLLEPDRLLGRTYAVALKAAGHSVRVRNHAQPAISALDKVMPDLIIIELQLAAHNGIEFLYELRSYRDWQTVPVMVLSNIPPYEIGINSKLQGQLGIVGYYYKPHTKLADLTNIVNRLPVTASV